MFGSPRYQAALHVGFEMANDSHREPGPAHFLVGIAEGDGPAAEALQVDGPMTLRDAVAACALPGTAYLHLQAQGATCEWAESRGEVMEPEHLLVALLDQDAPDVRETLRLAGIDAARARRVVLRSLGAPEDLSRIWLPTPTPAGTFDRPALPIAELPANVWRQLQWRQEHLPLRRLRRRRDWFGLYHLEQRAAWRLVERGDIDEDAQYSLVHHHDREVERRADEAAPDIVDVRPEPGEYRPAYTMPVMVTSRRRRLGRYVPNVFVGWPTWFRNRAVDLNATWFRLSTLQYYRGQPR